MKKALVLVLLVVTCFCAAVPASAQTADSYALDLDYLDVGSYGITIRVPDVLCDAMVWIYNGDGCRIDATLEGKNGSSWQSLAYFTSTGKVSGQEAYLEGDLIDCPLDVPLRVRFDFRAYVGNTQVEKVTEYSQEFEL